MSEKTKVSESVKFFEREFSGFKPDALLVLGSGLGELVRSLKPLETISFREIPHFPESTVMGHTGSFSLCQLDKTKLAVLSGRTHMYEGYSPAEVVRPVRVVGLLGVKKLILTNAAGSLNPLFDSGSIMCISDHINLTGENPLVGENYQDWGPMFPDMSRVYCPNLMNLAQTVALRMSIPLKKGVYVGVRGPCLETPAETRAYRMMGGDAIGMSTVPEAIAGKHMGMRILGLSCLTNKNLPDCMAETSHEQILEVARTINRTLTILLREILSSLEPR